MVEQLPKDVVARLRALDSAITPELAEASWALLTPFHEKLGYTAPRIVRDLPDVDCLVMGSDFPHAEGLAEPAEFAGLLTGLNPEQQRQILRDNAAKLFGV